VEAFSKKQEVKTLVGNYLIKLDKKDFSQKENLKLAVAFKDDTVVQRLAKNYIDQLSEQELYTSTNIEFLTYFTTKPEDKGFKIFYKDADRVDAIMGRGFGGKEAKRIVNDTELTPLFNVAKEKIELPDFDAITASITKKYNASFAKEIVLNGKVSWYIFLVNTKKETQYWRDLVTCRINQVKELGLDTMKVQATNINQICWIEVFHHCEDPNQLATAANWMEGIISRNPKVNSACFDTYACLLYKAGKLDEAISWEGKYLQYMSDNKAKTQMEYASTTIQKMKKGEKIWLEKEYQ
jgi:hypothetical protein